MGACSLRCQTSPISVFVFSLLQRPVDLALINKHEPEIVKPDLIILHVQPEIQWVQVMSWRDESFTVKPRCAESANLMAVGDMIGGRIRDNQDCLIVFGINKKMNLQGFFLCFRAASIEQCFVFFKRTLTILPWMWQEWSLLPDLGLFSAVYPAYLTNGSISSVKMCIVY